MPKVTYKKAGVDIQRAEEFIRSIKGSIGKSDKSLVSAFGSIYELKKELNKYKNPFLVASTDGVGTKLKLAQKLNIHNTVGVDLVAMNVNDIICLGAKPLFFLDYIACGKLNPKVLKKVVQGIAKGLRQADCLLLGGETAEMPGIYKKNEYDLAGFSVGIVEKNKIIDGRKIKQGDVILGLESSGLHSNGFSLVRKVFSKQEVKKFAQELLKPTRIYVKPILSLLQATSYPVSPSDNGAGKLQATRRREPQIVKGIAHITGGAFYEKATKILPERLGMVINKRSWPVPEIFKVIQHKGRISDKEMYTVFNMGIGMVLVVEKEKVDYVCRIIKKYKIKTYIIGEVVKGSCKMKIV